MDKNTLGAVLVCTLFYVGYQHYLDVKYPDRHKPKALISQIEDQAPNQASGETGNASAKVISAMTSTPEEVNFVPLKPEELVLENNEVHFVFNQRTGGLDRVLLKNIQDEDRKGPKVLVESPLFIQAAAENEKSLKEHPFQAERTAESLTFRRHTGNWQISQSYAVDPSGYGIRLRFAWKNTSDKAQELLAVLTLQGEEDYSEEPTSFLGGLSGVAHKPSLLVGTSQETKWRELKEFCNDGQVIAGKNSELWFLGFDSQYFMEVLVPDFKNANYEISRLASLRPQTCLVKETVNVDQGFIAPNEEVQVSLKGWFGPKSNKLITAYDNKLKEALDLGFFAKISHALFSALSLVNDVIGNWGLAIIVVTVLLKLLFYPLNRHAAFAQRDMKKLQPEMQRIKEKYKDDVALQQQETMRFMSEHKINPLKGCLPILVQIPVFIAFYRLLSTSVELRQAPFYGWIQDLSAQDPFFILPIVLGIGQVIQQRLMPMSGMDKATERIMMMMPIFFTIMTLTLPAGMVLYLTANTITAILQQQWLNKRVINA